MGNENITDLQGLLADAMAGDETADLPENPMDLVVDSLTTWPDIAQVLAKYPQGLPLFKKNELIAQCQSITQTNGSNPNLTIQVVRCPVLGGHTTKESIAVVHAPGRRRSGLTREISGACLRPAKKPHAVTATAVTAKKDTIPTTQKLAQLEKQAGALLAALQSESSDSPRYKAFQVQARHAWQTLADSLSARLLFLKNNGGAPRAIIGYQKALQKVQAILISI